MYVYPRPTDQPLVEIGLILFRPVGSGSWQTVCRHVWLLSLWLGVVRSRHKLNVDGNSDRTVGLYVQRSGRAAHLRVGLEQVDMGAQIR